MFKLEHDRKELWQWDINQRLIVEGIDPGEQVHFDSDTVTTYLEDGVIYADIPNEQLREYGYFNVYAYVSDGNGSYTKESAKFNVQKREKPDDYDANVMFGDTVNEILGEVIEGSLADKLAYLKDCLDILYQSPPIKLMREVYGENIDLRSLFEYVKEQENSLFLYSSTKELQYIQDGVTSGFKYDYPYVIYPDGSISKIAGYQYIAPKIHVYGTSQAQTANYIFAGDVAAVSGAYSRNNLQLADFRNIEFGIKSGNTKEMYNSGRSYSITIVCLNLYALYLPKISNLGTGTVDVDRSVSKPYIYHGVHLGKVVKYCSPTWLFRNINMDVSACNETRVYCDEGFYGSIYLEKLNIPLDCLIGLLRNLYDIESDGELSVCTLSIGSYNLGKIQNAIASGNVEVENAYNDAIAKGWKIQ